MVKLLAILASILLIALSCGCLENTQQHTPVNNSAANTVLTFSSQPTVNQSESATFVCQLNVTRGQGLDGKEIHWSVDDVQKAVSQTMWGYATYNLTSTDTSNLTVGKHVMQASFNGDNDYSASNATTTFQVQAAPISTPAPPVSANATAPPVPESIALNAPAQVKAGCTDIPGTHSDLASGENVYVLIKPSGNDTWTVQSLPYVFVNGTFTANVCFDKPTSDNIQYDVLALITKNQLNPSTTRTDVPQATAENRATVTVTQEDGKRLSMRFAGIISAKTSAY